MCTQPDTQSRHYAAKQQNSANLAVSQLLEAHLFGRPGQLQAQASTSENGRMKTKPLAVDEMAAFAKWRDSQAHGAWIKHCTDTQGQRPNRSAMYDDDNWC